MYACSAIIRSMKSQMLIANYASALLKDNMSDLTRMCKESLLEYRDQAMYMQDQTNSVPVDEFTEEVISLAMNEMEEARPWVDIQTNNSSRTGSSSRHTSSSRRARQRGRAEVRFNETVRERSPFAEPPRSETRPSTPTSVLAEDGENDEPSRGLPLSPEDLSIPPLHLTRRKPQPYGPMKPSTETGSSSSSTNTKEIMYDPDNQHQPKAISEEVKDVVVQPEEEVEETDSEPEESAQSTPYIQLPPAGPPVSKKKPRAPRDDE